MATKKTKRYTVWKGKEVGVFSTWEECKASVHGFTGAQYKSYPSRDAAEIALNNAYETQIQRGSNKSSHESCSSLIQQGIVEPQSICVDAACSSNPGKLERQGVDTVSGEIIFKSTLYPLGTTNVGERLAIIEGMQFLIENNKKGRCVYSDSRIAMGWIQSKTIRTQLPRNSATIGLRNLIDKQLTWLQSNTTPLCIKKRQTKHRGEIPADFGRK